MASGLTDGPGHGQGQCCDIWGGGARSTTLAVECQIPKCLRAGCKGDGRLNQGWGEGDIMSSGNGGEDGAERLLGSREREVPHEA